MLSLTRSRCADCGYDYIGNEDPHDVLKVGQEMVYFATKAIDEPWLCPEHRVHI